MLTGFRGGPWYLILFMAAIACQIVGYVSNDAFVGISGAVLVVALVFVRYGVRFAPAIAFGYGSVMLITTATSEVTSALPVGVEVRHVCLLAASVLTTLISAALVLRGAPFVRRNPRVETINVLPGFAVGLLVVVNFVRGGRNGAWLFLDWDNTANLGVLRHIFQLQGASYFEPDYLYAAYPHGPHALPIPFMGVPGSALTLASVIDGLAATFAISIVLLMVLAGAFAFAMIRLLVPGGALLPAAGSVLFLLLLVVPVNNTLDGTYLVLAAISPGFLTMVATLVLGLGILVSLVSLRGMKVRAGVSAQATLVGGAVSIAALANSYQPLAVVFFVFVGAALALRVLDARRIGWRVWVASMMVVLLGTAPPLIAVARQYGVAHGSIKGGTATVLLSLLATVIVLSLIPMLAQRKSVRPIGVLSGVLVLLMGALALAFYHQTGSFNRDAGTGENYYARKVELMLLWLLAPMALAVVVWLVSRVSREIAVLAICVATLFVCWQGIVGDTYGVMRPWPARFDPQEIAAIRSIRVNDTRYFASAQLSTNGLIETLVVNRALHDEDFGYPWGFYVQGLPVNCELVGPGVTVIGRDATGVTFEDCK